MQNTNEEIDKNLYSEKALNLLNISELRDIARKFGVPSPTTLKKKDLIDYILKIVYGQMEVPARNNYGRPSSGKFDLPKYLEKIKNNKEISSELMKVKLDMNYGNLMVSDKSQKYKQQDNIESRVLCGKGDKFYLKKHQFIDSNSDIEISSELVAKLNLEELDVIEIILIENEFKILTINGIKVQSGFKDMVVDGKPIVGGDKQDFYYSTKEEISKTIEEITSICNEKNIKSLIFSTEAYNTATHNFIYNKSEENSRTYKKFMNMLSICDKFTRESEDVVLILENMNDVEDMISSFERQVSERIKNNLEKVISKFLGLENVLISFRLEEDIIY